MDSLKCQTSTATPAEPGGLSLTLVFMKNNYGPIGAPVRLRWRNGVFVPESGEHPLDKAAKDQRAEEVFLALLDRFNRQRCGCSRRRCGPS
jgi:hypothetical protein